MTTLDSRLQLAMLNRKKGRNMLEKGFTLVELMIVIVIVGILSAVALPNFLNQTSKAKSTECVTKGATIMGLVSTEALNGTAAAEAAAEKLVEEANANSDICEFADITSSGEEYRMTATGKGDLTDKFTGDFCIDYATGRKDQKYTNTTDAPDPGAVCAGTAAQPGG